MAEIKISGLSHSYRDQRVLDNITVTLKKGHFYAIMGSSGSGKTTFLNIVSGLLKPTTGSIWFDSQEIAGLNGRELTKFRVNNVSFVFQDYSLIEHLNVKENIQFTKKISRQKIEDRKYREILKAVGLDGKEKSLPSTLSGGQKQRVAIARSLLSDADVIFADEPTGALDLSTRGSILKLLKEAVTKYGKTVVMVTHDPEAAAVAEAVMFLHNKNVDEIMTSNINSKNIATKLIALEAQVLHKGEK